MDRDQGWSLVMAMERMAEATVWASAYTDSDAPWDPDRPSYKLTQVAYAEKALADWRAARKAEADAQQAAMDANEKAFEAAMAKNEVPL